MAKASDPATTAEPTVTTGPEVTAAPTTSEPQNTEGKATAQANDQAQPTVTTGPETTTAPTTSEAEKPATEATETAQPAVTTGPETNSTPATSKTEAKNAEDVQPTVTTGPETTTAPTASQPKKPANGATDTPTTTSTVVGSHNDDVAAIDFAGEVQTNNKLPGPEVLRKIEDYTVLDQAGKSVPFKSLYTGRNVARRVLIIFVRHFLCGNCQEYLRTLAQSITPESLLRLPISTFIAVIGCGDPGMIASYQQYTNCPFPIYADPTRRLYDELGMVRTLAMGQHPAYMKNKSMAKSVVESVVQGLKHIRTGLVTKAGDSKQVGGEFLFEPRSIATPVASPQTEEYRPLESGRTTAAEGEAKAETNGEHTAEVRKTTESEDAAVQSGPAGTAPTARQSSESNYKPEEKRITWCHRMRTTRDHCEIPELMEVLGLDGEGMPIEDKKRWEKLLRTRKGTGLSMASRMNSLKREGGTA